MSVAGQAPPALPVADLAALSERAADAIPGATPDMAPVAQVAARHADAVDRDGRFPAEAVAALRGAGWMGAMLPRALGGAGLGLAAIAASCNRLARACASSAMIHAMHQVQVACLVRHALDDPWHRRFARRLAREGLLVASMTSETGIGGNLRASLCAVEIADERLSLCKRTPTMSYGQEADAYFASARSGPDAPRSDQVFVTLLRPEVSLTRTGAWNGLGLRGTGSGGFDLAATGAAAQVFPAPFAEIATRTMLPVSHLLWAAIWLGIAGDAVERARAWLREAAKRDPSAPPPGAVRLAHAAGLLRMVQARLRDALERYETDADRSQMAADCDLNALKHDASRLCLEAVQQALTICGMAGYRNDGPYSLGRHLRDMWSAPLMIGNDRVAANTGALLLAQRGELGGV